MPDGIGLNFKSYVMKNNPYAILLYAFLIGSFFDGHPVIAQFILFEEDFNGVTPPALPAGVITNSNHIFTGNPLDVPKCSYSGNLYFRNCEPAGEERYAIISGISTLGASDLKLYFCHRKTSCFETNVVVQWSNDYGNTWNDIAGFAMPVNSGWNPVSLSLPASAENNANLWLRWQYITFYASSNCAGGFNSCISTSGNYRIDELVLYSSILPVELTRFQAEKKDESVELSWQTATEHNSLRFDIETAADGLRFEKVGEVPAAGFSAAATDYHFIHANPGAGLRYYRLRQLDADGRSRFSPVVSVAAGGEAAFAFYPNPVRDVLHLRFGRLPAAGATVTLFDARGRPALSLAAGPGAPGLDLDARALPPGPYTLRLQDGRSVYSARLLRL